MTRRAPDGGMTRDTVTPGPGDWVRLVALRGVSSPTMRAQVGEVGTVLATLRRGGEEVVQAAFSAVGGVDDVFWLKPGEWELVGTAAPAPTADCSPAENISSPAENPPRRTREETHPVTDFATAVQTRIDQLTQESDEIEARIRDLTARRAAAATERRALGAAVSAYNRIRGDAPGALPRPAPEALGAPGSVGEKSAAALAFLREWTASRPTVVLTEAVAAAAARGLTRDHVQYALRTNPAFERVERGVYRLRADAAA
jgi:hypothetical protein